MALTLEKVGLAERDALAGLRAEIWHGALTFEQFTERNRRLDSHPYGKRIETFTLKDDEGVVRGSLDFLGVKLSVGGMLEDGILLAFVVTAPKDRGKGYGGELLTQAMKALGDRPSILYSDIGPAFYERFGYQDFSIEEISLATAPTGGKIAAERLTPDEMLSALQRVRRAQETLAVWPEADRCDWHLTRYRYLAELAGKPFPDECHWALPHSGRHLLTAVPDFMARRLDGTRVEPGCPKCLAFLHELASRWGLPQVRYWDETAILGTADRAYPMARASCGPWADRQLGDWW